MSASLHAVPEPSLRLHVPHAACTTVVALTAAASRDPQSIAHAVAVLRAGDHTANRPLDDHEAQALSTIYRHYADMLLAAARRVLGTSTDAEDALHDLFCRLPRLLAQYQGRGLGGWLRRAIVNEALMGVRRTRTRREDSLDPDHANAHPGAAGSCDDGELAWALRQLAPSLREVVVLRYWVGCSHREVADLLEITAAASEVRVCRAIKALRLMLQQTAHPRRNAAAARDARDESFPLRHASSF